MRLNRFFILLPAAAAAVMLYISWLRWPEVLVDFGREIYTPWLLSEGEVLYKDIAYWNGPLSPYFHSLLFDAFGPSIFIVQLSNLFIIGLLAVLIYRFYGRYSRFNSAPVVVTAFFVFFAFAQFFIYGNYNFASPYSHELTHGILIGFSAICMLRAYLDRRNILIIGAIGVLTGLSLLTKIEVTLATVSSVALSLILIIRAEAPASGRLLRMAVLFASGLILPLLAFTLFLGFQMPLSEAVKGMFGSWMILAGTDISAGKFYKHQMGMDDPATNLKLMLVSSAWLSAFLVPLALDYAVRKMPSRKIISAAAFVVTAVILAYFSNKLPWFEFFRPLPLAALAAGAILFFKLLRSKPSFEAAASEIPLFAMCVFSFILLLKIVLNVHIYHYGFALAMPATLLFLYLALDRLPAKVEKILGSASVFSGAALAFVAVMTVWFGMESAKVYSFKDFSISEWPDEIKTFDRFATNGADVKQAIEYINSELKPTDNFVALPEGAMLNYLSRRKNPTGYINFVPSEITMYGKEPMFEKLRAARPDYIVLVHKDTSEYGYRFFGKDYAQDILSWIESEYEPVKLIGETPFQSKAFGIMVMKRAGVEAAR
ncbi:hypothetical protein BAC1_02139 [uncultured bacterium]|nr:hypothetical protein BAC1_02139 [uncultured bacterium]